MNVSGQDGLASTNSLVWLQILLQDCNKQSSRAGNNMFACTLSMGINSFAESHQGFDLTKKHEKLSFVGVFLEADRSLGPSGLTAELAAWALESRKKRSRTGICRQTCRSTAATRMIGEPSCFSGKLKR